MNRLAPIIAACILPTVLAYGQTTTTLKPASDFETIAEKDRRSAALFEEAGKVLLHPRCLNCHPAGNRPLQGMAMKPHMPPAFRGKDNFGLPAMRCGTCHTDKNVELATEAGTLKSIPGDPNWHLAPIEMAWEGKSLHAICEQIKDVRRNGGKDLAAIVAHMAEDHLVGWAWSPGEGREPAPGTQKAFGDLIKGWAESGAVCPAA